MNQILYVEKSKKDSIDIHEIAKFSVVIIAIFAIVIIGKGIFGLINNSILSKANEPVLSIAENGDELEIKIVHDKAIDKIVYTWNNENETTLQGKGRTEILETIDLPDGNNILNLKVTDIDKYTTTYTKQYYKDASVDTTKPEIELAVEGSKVKIVAKDNKELSYLSYHWNNEDETVVEPREDSKKQIEERITVLRGENTLTIVAVDAAGNEQTKTQVFKGARKPTINVIKENDEVVIKITDDENIQKIEMNLNGEFFSTDSANTGASLDMQEAEIRQKLTSGENVITVTAYNVNGLSEQVTKTITI